MGLNSFGHYLTRKSTIETDTLNAFARYQFPCLSAKPELGGLGPSKFIVIQFFIQVNIIPFESKIKEETKADRIIKLALIGIK